MRRPSNSASSNNGNVAREPLRNRKFARLSAGGDWIRTSGTRATLALLQPKAPAPEPMVRRLFLLYEDGFYTPSYSCETSLFVWSVSIDTAIRPITPQPRM
jgi:hypothetical protein